MIIAIIGVAVVILLLLLLTQGESASFFGLMLEGSLAPQVAPREQHW